METNIQNGQDSEHKEGSHPEYSSEKENKYDKAVKKYGGWIEKLKCWSHRETDKYATFEHITT